MGDIIVATLNETARKVLIFPKEKPLIAWFGTIAVANLGFGIVRVYVSKRGNP